MRRIRFRAFSRPVGGVWDTYLHVANCPFRCFDLEVPSFSAILFLIRIHHPLRGVIRLLELTGSPNPSP